MRGCPGPSLPSACLTCVSSACLPARASSLPTSGVRVVLCPPRWRPQRGVAPPAPTVLHDLADQPLQRLHDQVRRSHHQCSACGYGRPIATIITSRRLIQLPHSRFLLLTGPPSPAAAAPPSDGISPPRSFDSHPSPPVVASPFVIGSSLRSWAASWRLRSRPWRLLRSPSCGPRSTSTRGQRLDLTSKQS